MLKILAKAARWLLILIVILTLSIVVFLKLSPQFGRPPSGEDLERMSQSQHYDKDQGVFVNQIETVLEMDFSKLRQTLNEFIHNKNTKPPVPVPSKFSDLTGRSAAPKITWFGHSAVLLQMGGKRILLDPMLGSNASPVPFFAGRFAYENDIPIADLKDIDFVLLSHDHYDHLDYESIRAIKDQVQQFFVPLGVGGHLERWGIPSDQIREFDWWQTATVDTLDIVFTPSRHFSGRGTSDRNATLWGSWAIMNDSHRIYFSGDSGYGPHFKEIGQKYGPFDFAMMECGQYNEKWEAIHMMPEQTVQASLDLNASRMMPIHWGAFQLASHTWDDPVLRASVAANKAAIDFVTPLIGHTMGIDGVTGQWYSELATSHQ